MSRDPEDTAVLLRAIRLADKQDGSEIADRMTVLWDDAACYVLTEDSIGLTVSYSAGGPKRWDRTLWIPADLLPALVESAQRVLSARGAAS